MLAKSFSVFSFTSSLARCTTVLPASFFNPVKCLSSQTSSPPKRPLNAYMRFVMQQKPMLARQNPDIKITDMISKVAHQWRNLGPDQKRPFEEAYKRAYEQFKVDQQHYKDQLSPAQLLLEAQQKRMKLAKRKSIRKKRELSSLGKPKGPRSAFNIFMSEHFEEATGTKTPEKLKSLMADWKSLLNHQKQVYVQLAEDDKIRYKNEMKSWEAHMFEIGREDLVRERTLSDKKKVLAAKTKPAAKKTQTKAKPVKKAAGKSKTSKKIKKITTVKTTRTTKKK